MNPEKQDLTTGIYNMQQRCPKISYLSRAKAHIYSKSKYNKVRNILVPLSHKLIGRYQNYEISVVVLSQQLEDDELQYIRDYISCSIKEGCENAALLKPNFVVRLYPKGELPSLRTGVPEMLFSVDRAGIVTTGRNVDINSKITQLLKDKRKQHRDKYPDNLKIYYLLINCPPHRLAMIDGNGPGIIDGNIILNNIENRKEIVVMCAMARSTEKKMVISSQLVKNSELFDFSNQYYSALT